MPDYGAMYRKLFNAQTDAIRILQQAQQETEEMYMNSPEALALVLNKEKEEDESQKDGEIK